jgi:histidinol-phosphate phosphatase family protein
MQRAVFLDRDGTIIEEKDYLSDPDQIVILPGAAAALRRLVEAGFKLFVVSNQSGIGRGFFTLAAAEAVNARLCQLLASEGVDFQKIYIAPEAPNAPSRGRKPSPEFLFDARDEFGIDLGASYMVGDKLIDLECGSNAGVRESILVRTGYGAETAGKVGIERKNWVVTDDLMGAAEWILRQQ